MTSLFGLLLSLAAWVLVMQAITWTWNQHAAVVVSAGIEIDARDRQMQLGRVARRHTLGWTAAIFVFFLSLELVEFPLWQLLLFAPLLGLVYGTSSIAGGEGEWAGREDPEGLALFGRRRDALWYRALAVADWTAYLVAIVFAADLALEVVS